MNLDILNLMGQINRACQASLQQSGALKSLDIAAFPARLLSVVSRTPGRTQQELAELLERDKAQVARTIRELEEKGLVTRIAHQTDWRALCPVVTDEGRRIAGLLNLERVNLAASMLRSIDDAEKQSLIGLLQKMLNELVPCEDAGTGIVTGGERRNDQ